MLKRVYVATEFFYGCYFLLQALLPEKFNLTSSLLGFILISIANWHFDGFRLIYIPTIIIQAFLLVPAPTVIRLPIALLMFLAILCFPIYDHPQPTGQYDVGYKSLVFQGPNGATKMAVYYPTLEKTRDVRYAPSKDIWVRNADFIKFFSQFQGHGGVPRILVKIAWNFVERHYLKVNKDAAIIKPQSQQKEFPVVVYSHGIASNIHNYSSFLKEWASHGFVVFSMDHEETIFFNFAEMSFEDHLKKRSLQLDVRKRTVSKVLDLVYDPAFITELFRDPEVKFNYDKIFLAGHSFGGGTTAELTAQDKRVTGGLALLDPWFECTDQKILHKPVSLPIMVLRSQQWDEWPQMRAVITKYGEVNKKSNDQVLSGFFKDSIHEAMTDNPFLIPRDMIIAKQLKSFSQIEDQLIFHIFMSRIFLLTALNSKGKAEDQNVATLTLSKFREEMKKLGKEDKLILDK